MINSPLIWVGGKSRAMPHVLDALPQGECLVEPFVGSGSVFLNTDYKTYILCDSNAALINFFSMVKRNTEALLTYASALFLAGNNEDAYYINRDDFNIFNREYTGHREQYTNDELAKYAALFLYLNRHCYNGVYRVNLKNEFNVPFGFRKKPIFPVAEIQHFAKRAWDKGAMFLHGDFRETLYLSGIQAAWFIVILRTCQPARLPILLHTVSLLPMKTIAPWLRFFHASTTRQKSLLLFPAVTPRRHARFTTRSPLIHSRSAAL